MARAERRAKRERLEARFALQMQEAGIRPDSWEREHAFHPTRRWRFDFAWPDYRVAVEIDGATFAGGRHTTGSGFQEDCRKLNAATELGWKVLRGTEPMLRSRELIESLVRVLRAATQERP